MYFKLLVWLACSAFVLPAGNIGEIRSVFLKAGSEQSSAEQLKTITASGTDALTKAYHGAAYAILAKHRSNPVKKLELLKTGLNLINSAVLLNAADSEIRFIRFSVEDNIPAFVPFSSHLEADKAMLLKNLNPAQPMYASIKAYLLKSGRLSSVEKAAIP